MKLKNLLYIIIFFGVHVLPAHAKIVLDDKSVDILLTDTNASFGLKKVDTTFYWIETSISQQGSNHFLIECLSPHLREVIAYIIKDNGDTVGTFNTGVQYPFEHRSLLHKNFIFPLNISPGEYHVLIGVKNYQPGELYFKIRSSVLFTEYAISEYFFLGCYYGILFIVLLYNLFLYLKGALRVHILYVFYIIGCIGLSMKEDGIAYQYILSDWPLLNAFFISYAAKTIFLLSFIGYALSFLEIKKLSIKIKNTLVNLFLGYLFLLILSTWIPQIKWISDYVYLSVFVVVYVVSILLARKRDRFAFYFFAGFSIVILSVLINILRNFNILPSTILTVYSFNYGIILEVIIFSVALADKIRLIQVEKEKHKEALIVKLSENDALKQTLIHELKEKEELQGKVNRELEEKVRMRTEDLHEANYKLEKFAKELDRMNAALDVQNYSLKKEIQHEKVSRIYSQEVSYEEFLESYPDDESCMKVIQKLKWADGFVCRKCGNLKCSNAGVWYRKKCSKCGTIESVTAHTVFHHLKFPLNKAFYLTYVEFSKLKHTDESLSEQIELRKPTVWAFRNKIEERLNDKHYLKASNWKDIVLDRN